MDVEQANLHQLATEVRVQMSGFLIRMVWLRLVQHFGEREKGTDLGNEGDIFIHV